MSANATTKHTAARGPKLVPSHFMLTDDAGVQRRIDFDVILHRCDRRSRAVFSRAVEILDFTPHVGAQVRRQLLAILVAVALLVPLFLLTSIGFARSATGTVAMLAVVLGSTWLFQRGPRRRRYVEFGERIGSICLAHAVCPGCLYQLSGVPADETGLMICPECGAAWKHERITPESTITIPTHAEAFKPGLGMEGVQVQRWVRDADGNIFSLLDAAFGKVIRSASDEDHRTRLREVRDTLRQNSRSRRLLAAFMTFAGTGYIVNIGLRGGPFMWPPTSVDQVLGWVLSFAALLLAGRMIWLSFNPHGHGADEGEAVRRMIAARLCPSCGGDLELALPADAGRIQCRDCLAVWKTLALKSSAAVDALHAQHLPSGCPACGYPIDEDRRKLDGSLHCWGCGYEIDRGVPPKVRDAVKWTAPDRQFCAACAIRLTDAMPQRALSCVCNECSHIFVALERLVASANPACPSCGSVEVRIAERVDVVKCPDCHTCNAIARHRGAAEAGRVEPSSEVGL